MYERSTNHRENKKGSICSPVQRQRIIEGVERVNDLGVCRSTYYGCLRRREPACRKPSVFRLIDAEREAVIKRRKSIHILATARLVGICVMRDTG